jgi:hypothetical protein
MPGLPGATPAANVAAQLPSLPGTSPAGTPAPSVAQNLPSLPSAPLTPTPERRLPTASDTPAVSPLSQAEIANLARPGQSSSSIVPAITPPPGPPPSVTAGTGQSSFSVTTDQKTNLQWMYDFGTALNTARSENKKVLVFFTAEGNQIAEKYQNEFFTNPAVRDALDHFVLVKVDFPKYTRLGYSMGIFGAGMLAIADESGKITNRIEQMPSSAQEFLRRLAGGAPPPASAPVAAVGMPAPVAAPAGVPGVPPASGAVPSSGTLPAGPVPAGAPPMGAPPVGAPAGAPAPTPPGLPPLPGAPPAPAA